MINEKYSIPIYMASVSYVIRNKKKVYQGKVDRVIFKGYSIHDLVNNHIGLIRSKIKQSIPKNSTLEIENVNLVMMLDYGIKE